MKLIKTILVGLIGLTMMFAQTQGQGNQQPPPEAQAYMQKYQETGDANEAFEAAAAVARANAEQGDDWDEQLFNDCKAEAQGAHDGVMDDTNDPQEAIKAALHAACVCSGNCPPYNPSVMKSVHKYKKNDWAVDESKESNEEWMAAYDDYDNWKDWKPSGGDDHGNQGGDHGNQGDQGDHGDQGGDHGDQGGTCDVCGHEFSGEGDHHGHCGAEGCDFVGSSDENWRGHCDANPEHCRPKAGDKCNYKHGDEDPCDYTFTGTEGEEHFHCNECGAGMGSGEDMNAHCQDNPDHCGGPGGGPGGPPPPNWSFEDVDADGDGVISRDEARAKYGTDPDGNEVPDFDQRFDEVDVNDSGDVDPAEHAAAQNSNQGGGPGGGPPQAGDTCGFEDADGNTCGYTFTGTMADADHKHN